MVGCSLTFFLYISLLQFFALVHSQEFSSQLFVTGKQVTSAYMVCVCVCMCVCMCMCVCVVGCSLTFLSYNLQFFALVHALSRVLEPTFVSVFLCLFACSLTPPNNLITIATNKQLLQLYFSCTKMACTTLKFQMY